MDHAGQTCRVDIDIGRAGGLRKPRRVRQQCLADPDLDQHRRKARQIGKQRRDQWIAAIDRGRRIGIGKLREIGLVDQRIDRVLGRQRAARHGEIGPRRQPGTGRQFLARGAQAADQAERQVAAGAVAPDRDTVRCHALPAEKAPRGQRIFKRRRVGMFGRRGSRWRGCGSAPRGRPPSPGLVMADDRTGAVSPP